MEMVLLCYFIGLSIGWFILGFSYLRLFLSTPRIKRREISYLLKTAKPIPALSIIIPARNEERYIKRCLQSLLWQHYESFEIIMVDDNSTDDTIDIAKTIKDRRSKLITLRRTPPRLDREKLGISGWIFSKQRENIVHRCRYILLQ